MRRADSLEKTLMMGKIEGKRRRGRQRIRWLDSITSSIDMNLNKHQEIVEDRAGWHAAVHGVTKSQTQPSDWTTSEGMQDEEGWIAGMTSQERWQILGGSSLDSHYLSSFIRGQSCQLHF